MEAKERQTQKTEGEPFCREKGEGESVCVCDREIESRKSVLQCKVQ